ncbi:hypothetical protein IHQ75_05870 [Bifidobacterium dentium]|uniref:zonular occludens toxin domain-containing protein n=1 Tax=Bifidobacterium dentium TaxID=1689 RepID=UPI0018C32CE6|nr:zonular occludens toxin domain-containing protein [Bifidobacterium dentium]MBF9710491.1 hypothetical protein [Bifidobacterium dentium]
MDILLLILKIFALTALLVGLMHPLSDVAAWDEPGWKTRHIVCAIATTLWSALLLFNPKFTTLVTVCVLWTIIWLVSLFHPSFRNLLPLLRCLTSLRHRIKGNSPEFIVERVLCLRPFEDSTTEFSGARDYKAVYKDNGDEKLLEFICGLTGVTDSFVEKKVQDGLGAMGAETYKIDKNAPAHWLIHFYRTVPKNPLDEDHTIKVTDITDWNGKSVIYGLFESGDFAKLSFEQVSGIVAGGVPGSGKSAGSTVLTYPLLKSAKASVYVFDGKGGLDWSWAQHAASLYNNDCDLDLETATEQLESLAERCVNDLKSHPWSESDPDFWHTGASAMHPFHLVVIDECQTLFDITGRSKEDKALVERCKRAVATIVRKGRSAGWCVMLLTQKPTADSIPTNIRDNCVVRFGLRVTTREASEAILGSIPDGDPTPTEIPSNRRGGAVVQSEDGHTKSVRFFYLPVTEAARALNGSTLEAVTDGLTA